MSLTMAVTDLDLELGSRLDALHIIPCIFNVALAIKVYIVFVEDGVGHSPIIR